MPKGSKSLFSRQKYKKTAKDYKVRTVIFSKIIGKNKIDGELKLLTDEYCITELSHVSGRFPPKSYYSGEFSTRRLFNEARKHGNSLGNFPRLFNPIYQSRPEGCPISPKESSPSQQSAQEIWHPVNSELFFVANIILMAWGNGSEVHTAESPLCEIIMKLSLEPSVPHQHITKSLKTILSKDYKQRTLEQMIDDLRKTDPRMRKPALKLFK